MGFVLKRLIERIDTVEALDCPIFIISAPRAGSTLLFDIFVPLSQFLDDRR